MARLFSVFAAPLICLGLLGGIGVGAWAHGSAKPAEAFHARVKVAILAVPYVIGDWVGSDVPVPPAAVALLKPNCILSRRYILNLPNLPADPISANVLIVQCRDSRDMAGHYPPICYPAAGERLLSSCPFLLTVGAIAIHGTEYHFAPPAPPAAAGPALPDAGLQGRCVYDFFVVPGVGIVADIAHVRSSAADRDRRQFGAAQIQLVISDRYSQSQRESALADLLGGDEPLLRTLAKDE